MTVKYNDKTAFKNGTPFDNAAIERVALRRPYGNEPGSSTRVKKMVSKNTKIAKGAKGK